MPKLAKRLLAAAIVLSALGSAGCEDAAEPESKADSENGAVPTAGLPGDYGAVSDLCTAMDLSAMDEHGGVQDTVVDSSEYEQPPHTTQQCTVMGDDAYVAVVAHLYEEAALAEDNVRNRNYSVPECQHDEIDSGPWEEAFGGPPCDSGGTVTTLVARDESLVVYTTVTVAPDASIPVESQLDLAQVITEAAFHACAQ